MSQDWCNLVGTLVKCDLANLQPVPYAITITKYVLDQPLDIFKGCLIAYEPDYAGYYPEGSRKFFDPQLSFELYHNDAFVSFDL